MQEDDEIGSEEKNPQDQNKENGEQGNVENRNEEGFKKKSRNKNKLKSNVDGSSGNKDLQDNGKIDYIKEYYYEAPNLSEIQWCPVDEGKVPASNTESKISVSKSKTESSNEELFLSKLENDSEICNWQPSMSDKEFESLAKKKVQDFFDKQQWKTNLNDVPTLNDLKKGKLRSVLKVEEVKGGEFEEEISDEIKAMADVVISRKKENVKNSLTLFNNAITKQKSLEGLISISNKMMNGENIWSAASCQESVEEKENYIQDDIHSNLESLNLEYDAGEYETEDQMDFDEEFKFDFPLPHPNPNRLIHQDILSDPSNLEMWLQEISANKEFIQDMEFFKLMNGQYPKN